LICLSKNNIRAKSNLVNCIIVGCQIFQRLSPVLQRLAALVQ